MPSNTYQSTTKKDYVLGWMPCWYRGEEQSQLVLRRANRLIFLNLLAKVAYLS